jgi:tetratricopeptide (TPR) repeat protein
MLETIRDYSRERLQASGERPELRRRHAAYFLELVAAASAELGSGRRSEWLNRFAPEIENVRCVLAWSLDHDVEEGLGFAVALQPLWLVRGHGYELTRWYAQAFHRAEAVRPDTLVRALKTAGDLHCFMLGEADRARQLYDEGMALARELGDELAEAWFVTVRGTMAADERRYEEAVLMEEQALETFRRHGDGEGEAMALNNIADNLMDQGAYDRAAEKFQEAIATYERLGERWGVAFATNGLADVSLLQGDGGVATERYRDALAIAVELDDKRTIAYCLAGLSCVAALAGDLDRAGTRWAAAELFEVGYGSPMMVDERARYERLLDDVRADAAFAAGYERGRELTLEGALEDVLDVLANRTDAKEGWRMGLEPTTTGTTTRGSTN